MMGYFFVEWELRISVLELAFVRALYDVTYSENVQLWPYNLSKAIRG